MVKTFAVYILCDAVPKEVQICSIEVVSIHHYLLQENIYLVILIRYYLLPALEV